MLFLINNLKNLKAHTVAIVFKYRYFKCNLENKSGTIFTFHIIIFQF